ncbi:hypothetical protein MXB_2073 [Myxobolus squamalis]|nr:hypothetical protein MXB_2073 [Myxobolus squamalis]
MSKIHLAHSIQKEALFMLLTLIIEMCLLVAVNFDPNENFSVISSFSSNYSIF